MQKASGRYFVNKGTFAARVVTIYNRISNSKSNKKSVCGDLQVDF